MTIHQDGNEGETDTGLPAATGEADTGSPASIPADEGKSADAKDGAGDREPKDGQGRDVNAGEDGGGKAESEDPLLSAVKKVLTKKGARSPTSGGEGGPETDQGGKDADGKAQPGDKKTSDDGDPSKDDYLSAEEMAQLSPRAKKRINTLWRERQEAREQVDRFTRDVAPRAQQWEQMTSFLDTHGMSDQEAAELLIIGALLKTDPNAAWERMKPQVEKLQAFLGIGGEAALPDDLRQEVENGEITEQRAREIAALRNQREFTTRRSQQTAQQAQERDAHERQVAHVGEVDRTIRAREQAIAAKDPDYWTVKAPMVADRLSTLLSTKGFPKSAKEAAEMYDDALKGVEDHLAGLRKRMAPARGQTRQPTNGRSSATDRGQPADIYQAARMGLEKARGLA